MGDVGTATVKLDLDMEPFKAIVHAAVDLLNEIEDSPVSTPVFLAAGELSLALIEAGIITTEGS